MRDEETIFNEARTRATPMDRATFLDQACAADPQLRQAVEALLAAHDRAGGILDEPPPGVDTKESSAPTDHAGTVIGRYKLLEQIGEGGMGTVFMAEQHHPVRRRVALKIIKPGLDTKQVIARFEAERQALAMMEHPCIAKVFDAGITDAGRSYFVMELVRGIPLTEYCDKNQLNPRQRLELFVQVCSAVQHAHQKGVIHRDLKPTNVLVTLNDGTPTPKIIDFGIAKATGGMQLTDRTLFTNFSQLIGTPIYMSPEQAEMSALMDVDTRSDVYSLGVLLYELLTGTTPFDKKRLAEAAYDEVRRIIREEEPPRPSTRLSTLGETLSAISAQRQTDPKRLGSLVRGELDWIVMKALEKDRTRRYETANGLARDVQRYLSDQPVEACPPARMYRLRKLARRNKAALVMGSTIAAVLVVATVVSTWQAILATRAKQTTVVALREAEQARENEGTARVEAVAAQQIAVTERATAENGKAEIRQLLYNTQMTFAGQKAETPAGISVVQALIEPWREGKPDLRGWEWYYLNALSHPELMTLSSEDQVRVYTVEWSPDGTRLASGDVTGIVRIWDAASGKILFTFAGHAGRLVSSLAWSPDSTRLATSSEDGVVKVWNPANGIEAFTHRQNTRGPVPLGWNSQSGTLAVGQGSLIVIRSSVDGAEIRRLPGHQGWVSLLAWSKDGKRLASGGRDSSIRVWDANTGVAVHTFPGIADVRSGPVNALAWNPEGTRLASAGGGSPVRIWDMDVSTGEPTAEFTPHPGGAVLALAWDRSGKRLVTAGDADRSLKVWDATNFTEPLFSLPGHTDSIARLSWNPDGTRIASASWDGTIKVWAGDVPRHVPVTTNLIGTEFPGTRSVVRSLALHPDGHRLAVGGMDGKIRIVDTATYQEVMPPLLGHTGWVLGLVWSPDGKRLASGSADRTVRIWDPSAGKQVFPSSPSIEQPKSVRWSPDGTQLAVTSGTTIKIRIASTGDESGVIFGHHTRELTGVAWKPDGKQLASASQDGTVKIWNSTGGEAIFTLRGHTDQVLSVAWSPDSTRLATSSRDRTIKIWNPATGQEIFSYTAGGTDQTSVLGAAWSEDGTKLTFSLGNEVYVLDATRGYALARLTTPAPTTRPSRGELVQQRLREHLALQRTYRDEAHPDVLATLGRLATSLQQSGKFSDAEPLFRQVITLRRKSLGEANVETRDAVKDIAGLVIAQLKTPNERPASQPADREGLALMHRLEAEYADSPELLSAFYLSLIGPLMELGLIEDAKTLSRKIPALNLRDVSVLTESVHIGNFPPDRVVVSDALTLSQIARRFASSTKPVERDIPLAIELAQRLVQFYEAIGNPNEAAAWRMKLPATDPGAQPLP